MLIDTHAHIYLDQFSEDIDEVIKRAKSVGIKAILLPAIDLPSIERAMVLKDRWDFIHVMAAIHPCEVNSATEDDFLQIEAWAARDEIIAIGETGLDYYWDTSYNEKQQEFVRRHIQLAAKVNKPIVFHDRGASDDLVRIVAEEKACSPYPERIRGVFHCFGGPEHICAQVLDLGFHVGLGGTYTFKNGGVPQAVSSIPLDRIVLETDAPYLAPAPFRGKRNEPAFVDLVAQKIAEIRGLSADEVACATSENAARVFGLSDLQLR